MFYLASFACVKQAVVFAHILGAQVPECLLIAGHPLHRVSYPEMDADVEDDQCENV